MSKHLEGLLATQGYDAATAREVVKMADGKTDAEATEFLSDLFEDPAEVKRYITLRARSRPQPTGRASKAASPQPSSSTGPGVSSSRGQVSRPTSRPGSAPGSRASTPGPAPVRSVAARPGNKPYSLAFQGLHLPPQPTEASPEKKVNKEATTQFKIESIKDLDAALSRLEVSDGSRRPCDCMGSVHGLLEIAPNCLNCGKIVCNKEGLGPCLSCGAPLLSDEALGDIYAVLYQQRQDILSSMGRRALKAAGIDPDLASRSGSAVITNLQRAQENRDKLLNFQDSAAVRTKIIDQASEYETPDTGTNLWASPAEQARQLRNQQRLLRKQEELRKARSGRGRKVISIDIRGNKVYSAEEDAVPDDESDNDEPETPAEKREGGDDIVEETPTAFYKADEFSSKWVKPIYPTGQQKEPKLKESSYIAKSKVAAYDEDLLLAYS